MLGRSLNYICEPEQMRLTWQEIQDGVRLTEVHLKNKASERVKRVNLHVNAACQPKSSPFEIVFELQVKRNRP